MFDFAGPTRPQDFKRSRLNGLTVCGGHHTSLGSSDNTDDLTWAPRSKFRVRVQIISSPSPNHFESESKSIIVKPQRLFEGSGQSGGGGELTVALLLREEAHAHHFVPPRWYCMLSSRYRHGLHATATLPPRAAGAGPDPGHVITVPGLGLWVVTRLGLISGGIDWGHVMVCAVKRNKPQSGRELEGKDTASVLVPTLLDGLARKPNDFSHHDDSQTR
eukprot:3189087-Rhodomonas_salina.1